MSAEFYLLPLYLIDMLMDDSYDQTPFPSKPHRYMELLADNVVPLYRQIFQVLRRRILDGEFANQPLPPELTLMRSFGVSRVTMRRALQCLVDEGLVSRGRGKGTFVKPPADPASVPEEIAQVLDSVKVLGRQSRLQLLELEMVQPPPALRDELGLSPGVLVQRAIRVCHYQAAPLSYLLSYVPQPVAALLSPADLATQPILTLLETAGVRIGKAQQTLSARRATAQEAQWLEMQPGDAVLTLRRLVFDQADQPLQLSEGAYRPDRYAYCVDLLAKAPSEGGALWSMHETLLTPG